METDRGEWRMTHRRPAHPSPLGNEPRGLGRGRPHGARCSTWWPMRFGRQARDSSRRARQPSSPWSYLRIGPPASGWQRWRPTPWPPEVHRWGTPRPGRRGQRRRRGGRGHRPPGHPEIRAPSGLRNVRARFRSSHSRSTGRGRQTGPVDRRVTARRNPSGTASASARDPGGGMRFIQMSPGFGHRRSGVGDDRQSCRCRARRTGTAWGPGRGQCLTLTLAPESAQPS